MNQLILALHVLGAVGMGFYMILPFVLAGADKQTPEAQKGFVGSLYGLGRIAQFLLIVQFLTGGYLISQADYTVLWMILIIVLFIVIAALTGIAGGRMKKFIKQDKDGGAHLSKAKTFSWIAAVCYFVIVILMVYPMYR